MGSLRALGLKKDYRRRPVVRDVSLYVNKAEIVGLLGPNGAGKTTCFYMIAGLVSVDQGKVWINGVDISDFPVHKRSMYGVGYLPQESSIFRRLTAYENVRAVLELVHYPRADIHRRCEELLSKFGLWSIRNSLGLSLSGGERRRVELARTLAVDPKFVLLDEPFSGVDPIAVHDMKIIFSYLRSVGIGILITDHNVRETLDICDRAYIITEGSVLASGTAAEIVDNEQVRRIYLGDHFHL